MRQILFDLARDRRAATAIEYAILGSLIAIVIVGAVTTIGHTLSGTFTTVATSL